MSIIGLKSYIRSSSSGQYSHVPLEHDAVTRVAPPSSFIVLEGPLSEGRWLMPILVKIVEEEREKDEEREFVISEMKYSMHGTGETVTDAVAAFKRIVLQYLDGLTEREDHLSLPMYEQLEYLRSVIRIVQ